MNPSRFPKKPIVGGLAAAMIIVTLTHAEEPHVPEEHFSARVTDRTTVISNNHVAVSPLRAWLPHDVGVI